MRNLKKLFAVILVVAMLASMMVPALAANTYEAEALKLQAINVFAGGPADLKLDEGVTRIQGLTFAIRAAGKDADALAMTDAEVDAILADWTDAASIPAWGRNYAAYAIKNGITVGLSATEKIFGALNPISGTSFLVFIMKSGMGYADVTTANVVEAAVTAGILTAGQAATFGAKEALIRDDAAGILYGAFTTGTNADGTKLIDAYIASGATTLEAAVAAGFAEEPVPEELAFLDASAPNLIQIVLELNGAEYDEKELKQTKYYEVSAVPAGQDDEEEIDIDKIDVDGDTVTITLDTAIANQTEGTITIDEDIAGEDVEFELEFFDTTIPRVENVEVIGKDTLKVTFSEPMAGLDNTNKGEFKIKKGSKSFSVKQVSPQKNGVEAKVEVYGTFTEGTLTVAVGKGLEDYAGFNVIARTFEVEVVVDETAPVVTGYKDASREEVTLIFDEDIKFSTYKQENFYHTNTNASNRVNSQPEIDGNEITLDFSTSKLPEGTAYVYIKSGAVQDYWGNKNDTIKVKIDVDEDVTPPEVTEVKLTVDTLKVVFNEKLDKDIAEDRDNYILKDEDGDEVSLRSATYSWDPDDEEATVTIRLRSDIDEGVYTLEVVDVEDLAGNAMDDYETELELDDTTAPTFPDFAYVDVISATGKGEYEIYLIFDEELAVDGKYDATDLNKYELDGDNLGTKNEDDDYKVTLEMLQDNKVVKITVKGDDENVRINVGVSEIEVGRIADVAGNYTALSTTLDTRNISTKSINIEEAVATAKDTIEVTFEDALDEYEIDDFIVTDGVDTYAIDSIDVVDDDEIVITLEEDLPADTSAVKLQTVADADDINTENSFGLKLAANQDIEVEDEIAPAVEELDDTNVAGFEPDYLGNGDDDDVQSVWAKCNTGATTTSVIYIQFDEDLEYIHGNLGIFEVNGGDNEVLAVTEADGLVTITVDGEILKGDDIVITVVFDTAGNKAEDITVEVEYAVEQL
ncbi:MAG: Ig-like domain-containing protein [Acetivibrionales bacterium]|jgi:hypothetical protein